MSICTQIREKIWAIQDRAAEASANFLRSDTIKKICRTFSLGMGCWSTYNLFDSGLSRLLALETLTHGTGPLGYLGINLNGADPAYGGTGSSLAAGSLHSITSSKNYFHVFKDSAIFEGCFGNLFCNTFGNELAPRHHAILSGKANFDYSEGSENFIRGALGTLSGFLTPTLKFRFTPNEILNCANACRFENDPDYYGAAYRTSKPIAASHLGITGSLTQGINSSLFDRMAADPTKVLIGAALLTTAAFVGRATYRYFSSHPTPQAPSPISSIDKYQKDLDTIATGGSCIALAIAAIFLNTL